MKYPVIQNRTYATPKAARRAKIGDFALGISSTTGHVMNIAFDPSRIVYDKSYNNAQTHSAIFQRHLNTVADYVAANFRDKKVVEIGCGDGTFLKLLSERGLSAIGFDPSSSTASDRIFPRTFSPGEVEADVFILRHVLEHIHHPELFLAGLASRHPAADLVVEVPDLDWTLQNNAWFDFYYEHVNYFDSQSLTNLFAGRFRFKRVFGNQYLMGIGNLADLSTGALASNKSALRRLEAAQQCIRTAREDISALPSETPLVLWGAGSKGVIFAIHAEEQMRRVRFMIDQNPAKQGRYAPVTGIPILSPDVGVTQIEISDQVLVLNPNYLKEIQAQLPTGQDVKVVS